MDAIIKLAADMNWPFALATAALCVSFAVPAIVRSVGRSKLALAEVDAAADIEKVKVQVTAKNAAIAHQS